MPLPRRKISVGLGISLLIAVEAVGVALLLVSSFIKALVILQAVMFLVSMVLIWYAAHSLSHLIAAKISGVPTLFFFLAPSDMGKNGPPFVTKLSRLLVTVGTRLDRSKLSSVPRVHRALIFGSGALVGLVVLAAIESLAILSFRFDAISLGLGGLFFLFTLGTELLLGSKSGDLSKMKRELSKAE